MIKVIKVLIKQIVQNTQKLSKNIIKLTPGVLYHKKYDFNMSYYPFTLS